MLIINLLLITLLIIICFALKNKSSITNIFFATQIPLSIILYFFNSKFDILFILTLSVIDIVYYFLIIKRDRKKSRLINDKLSDIDLTEYEIVEDIIKCNSFNYFNLNFIKIISFTEISLIMLAFGELVCLTTL